MLPANRKEIHFFDREVGVDWLKPDYALYHAEFPHPRPAHILFETTPIYLFWPPSLARIREYNPDVSLIFIFRDPIERAWSHWNMERSRSAEDLPFSAAIRSGRQRLHGIHPLGRPWRVYSYVERGFYGLQVRRLLKLFPRRQILFLKSSDLRHDQELTLAKIAAFLGIAPFPALAPRADRKSVMDDSASPLSNDDITYLAGLYRADLEEFAGLTELAIDDWPVMKTFRL